MYTDSLSYGLSTSAMPHCNQKTRKKEKGLEEKKEVCMRKSGMNPESKRCANASLGRSMDFLSPGHAIGKVRVFLSAVTSGVKRRAAQSVLSFANELEGEEK
jgi:hypothetical protein